MSESFNFNEWIRNNKMGPYSKDSFSRKGMLKESEGHIEEDDTMEEAPVPPSPENIYEPDSEQDYYDRAMGLAGMQIKDAIDALMQDGFEKEEIEELLPRLAMTLIMDYDTAFSGMDEGEVSEAYGSFHVNRKYPTNIPGVYQDDEGNYFNSKGQDTDSEGNVIDDEGSSRYAPRPRSAGEQEYDRLDRQFRISGLIPKTKNANHFVNAVNKFFRNRAEKMNTTPYQMSPSTIAYAKQEYERKSKKDSPAPPPPANP